MEYNKDFGNLYRKTIEYSKLLDELYEKYMNNNEIIESDSNEEFVFKVRNLLYELDNERKW
jgi:hypothetical protein